MIPRVLCNPVIRARLVDRAAQGTPSQPPVQCMPDSFSSNSEIFAGSIRPSRSPAMQDGRTRCTRDTNIGVDHKVAEIRQCQHEALHKLNRELAGVNRLLYVVVLYIGDRPQISGVLAQGVAGILPGLRTFEVFLSRIFLWNADRIEVEDTVVAFLNHQAPTRSSPCWSNWAESNPSDCVLVPEGNSKAATENALEKLNVVLRQIATAPKTQHVFACVLQASEAPRTYSNSAPHLDDRIDF